MPKSFSELKNLFKNKKDEYLKLKAQNTTEALEQEARGLLKLLFEKYKAGGIFLKETQKEAKATCEIASPNGRVRHLWGYLHFSPSIHAAMNRQGPNCVDIDTECLTKKGWRKVSKLSVGDEIYTKNVTTGNLELQPIRKIVKSYYKGKMWRLESGIDALVTPEHRWLVDYGKQYIPKMLDSNYLANSKNNNPIHLVSDRVIPQEGTKWSDEEVKLIGWILTDGTYAGNRIRICQSIVGNPEKVKIIDAIIPKVTNNFWRAKKPEKTGTIRWSLKASSCITVKIRESLPDKILTPKFLRSLSSRQLQLLYDNMMLGNGNWNAKTKQYVDFGAGTKKKADMFAMLCVLLGVPCHVYSKPPIKPKKKYASMPNIPNATKDFWIVKIKQRNRCQAVSNYNNWVDYEGEVWCPNVKNGTFIAKRNGSIYVTGNSIVQGFSSDEGFEANRILDKMCWFFFKRKGQPFSLQPRNVVHDSSELTAHAIEMPIAAYLAEHAYTTQCAKRYRQVYGIEFNVGLEIEMNFGPTLAHIGIGDLGSDLLTAEGKKALEAWDFRAENLMRLIEASLTWSRDNLYYDVDIDFILKKAEHNNNIIADLRKKEIRYSYDRKEPVSEKMLMNSENSLDFGLVFEKPFKDRWGRE